MSAFISKIPITSGVPAGRLQPQKRAEVRPDSHSSLTFLSPMSSTPSTPSSNRLSDIFGAMNEDSPATPAVTTAQKRSHAAIDGTISDDDEDTDKTGEIAPLVLTTNQNTVSAVQRYTEKKRLRVDQAAEVSLLVSVSLSSPLLLSALKNLVQGPPGFPPCKNLGQPLQNLEPARRHHHGATQL